MNKKTVMFIALIIAGALLLAVGAELCISAIGKKIYPTKYENYVEKYSEKYNVPQSVIYAIINTESNFDPEAVSSAGAMGLMQMMPSTFEWLTSDEQLGEGLTTEALNDPEVSIRYGTYYLAYLHRKFDYNWNNAFAAYNAGEGNVAKWLASDEHNDGEGNLVDIPFKETRSYVKKINDAIEIYSRLYPDLT